MDLDAWGERLPFILAIIAFIVLQFFLRRKRKPATTRFEIVQTLLGEVRLNQAIVGTFAAGHKLRKLEVVTWQQSREKLDFLNQPVRAALSDAYRIAEEFNQQLDTAKKHKLSSSLANINADRLSQSLSKSREGLEEWLMSETGSKATSPKPPGILDDWTGKR